MMQMVPAVRYIMINYLQMAHPFFSDHRGNPLAAMNLMSSILY